MNLSVAVIFVLYLPGRSSAKLGPVPTTTYDEEAKLRTNLTASYEQNVRPDIPTVVSTFYSLRTLKTLSRDKIFAIGTLSILMQDIAEEKMGTVGWLTLLWEDPRLTWDSADYAGIETLEMTTAWRPNFFIANEIKESSSFGFTTTDPVRVYNTGTVRWLVPLNIDTGCDVDIAQFPFDSQTCSINFIYWITSKAETTVTKQLSTEEVNTEFYHEHGEWELRGTNDELVDFEICCPDETVQRNIITLQFKRRRPYYIINILVPTLLMSVCVVWTFILPTPSGERIGYSLTILLSYTVFLTVTSDLLPSTSKQTPTFGAQLPIYTLFLALWTRAIVLYVTTYLLVVLVLSLLSVSLTVWNVKFYNLEEDPPKILRKIFAKLRRIVFFECRKATNGSSSTAPSLVKVQPISEADDMNYESRDSSDSDVTNYDITWKVISEVLDRLYFFLFFAGIAILNTALIGSLANENAKSLQLG